MQSYSYDDPSLGFRSPLAKDVPVKIIGGALRLDAYFMQKDILEQTVPYGHTMFTDFSYERDDADAFLESIEEDDVLLSLSEIRSVYQPEDLRAMGAAYDMACATLPSVFRNNERARLKLATVIIRAINRGVRDLDYLADVAILDFLR